jgi:AcrR family transcriptional regulator
MTGAVQVRDVRGAIFEAAARLIANEGFHGMSMRHLARAADTSLSNLYNYFSSKEEILFALQRQAFETLVASASEALERVEDPTGRLYIFISHHLHYFAAHPEVMRVLVHEAASLPPKQRHTVRRLKNEYFRLGREILLRLIDQGYAGGAAGPETAPEAGTRSETPEPVADAELDRVTYSVFGMLNWIYGWYDPRVHGSARDLARTIHRIVLCGVVTRCPFRDLQESLELELQSFEQPPLLGFATTGGHRP